MPRSWTPILFFALVFPRPTRSTLFPYTTLFRSEISRAQLWQWMRNGAALDDGRVVTADLYAQVRAEELTKPGGASAEDRKSTRLNSSHMSISYAVFCLKKKKSA